MKYCRLFMFFLGLFLIAAGTLRADGDDVLDRLIRLPKMKGTVYALLGKVSECSGYLFVYDSKIVNNDAVVRIKGKECTVRQAIYGIIGNKTLELKVIGQHILILHADGRRTEIEKETGLSYPAYFTVSGRLRDKETGESIVNASVAIQGTSMGNVTNKDGGFRLHLPDSLRHCTLSFSHLGYVAQDVEAAVLVGRDNILSLEPKVVPLQEVVVQWVDPYKLLKEMGRQREQNYSHSPAYLTTFYREGVLLKNKVQNLTEAVFKVYKIASHSPVSDQAKLLKMSRLSNVEAKDSLLVKVKSGIQACIQMDIIKDMPEFLTPSIENSIYTYTSEGVTFLEDRFVNVVHFEQKKGISEPLFCGELFLDSETSALLQARLEVHPVYVKNAAGMFVERRARNVRMTPQKVVYTISYKPWQGTYYIHHIRGDLHFKVKRVKMLFGSRDLHIWFEMITCKVDTEQVVVFPRTDRLPTRTIFSDTYFKYDENFWRDFNVIPLEEEISKLIEKISLKIEEIGD